MHSPRYLFAAVCCCAGSALMPGCYKPASSELREHAALPPQKSAAPSSTPSATTAGGSQTSPAAAASATAAAPQPSASAAPTGDRYVRPARTNLPIATASTSRSSRSPIRKTPTGAPPPRTRVLEAPQAGAGVLGITFDSLMFPMQKQDPFSPTLLTDSVRALFDKRVKIRGFIHPSCPFEKGVKQFILVRDDQGCCFGPGALLYDCIIVDMVPGKTTNFSTRPVAVEGLLTFREYKDLSGKHEAIFHLDAETVE